MTLLRRIVCLTDSNSWQNVVHFLSL